MTINAAQSEAQEVSQAPVKENSAENNLRKMARALEEERSARISLEQKMQEHMERFKAPQKSQDDDYSSGDPYIDEKRLDRKLSAFAENFGKQVNQQAEEKAAMMIEKERQGNFLRANPDFAQILNDETLLQKFVQKHPEIAEPLLEMPDNFSRKKLVYQNIKALGLNRPEQPKNNIQDRIDANRTHPGYQPSGVGNPSYQSTADFSATGQKSAYDKMKAMIGNRRGV